VDLKFNEELGAEVASELARRSEIDEPDRTATTDAGTERLQTSALRISATVHRSTCPLIAVVGFCWEHHDASVRVPLSQRPDAQITIRHPF
jgi:hypothetical protein